MLYASPMVVHAEDLVGRYMPGRETFVYALDTFVKHDSQQGIAKLTEQIKALKEADSSFRLSKGTSNYIKGVRERLIERKQDDKIRLIAPFLLESGVSFIDELGKASRTYRDWNKLSKRYGGNEKEQYYLMHSAHSAYRTKQQREYEIKAVMEQPRVIGLDLILSNENYVPKNTFLKKYFSSFSSDMRTKILQAAERDYCDICQPDELLTARSKQACGKFQENLEGLREWHAASKEQEAAQQEPINVAENISPDEQPAAPAGSTDTSTPANE